MRMFLHPNILCLPHSWSNENVVCEIYSNEQVLFTNNRDVVLPRKSTGFILCQVTELTPGFIIGEGEQLMALTRDLNARVKGSLSTSRFRRVGISPRSFGKKKGWLQFCRRWRKCLSAELYRFQFPRSNASRFDPVGVQTHDAIDDQVPSIHDVVAH